LVIGEVEDTASFLESDILILVSITGRAMRPRSADSFRNIYRKAAKVAKERGGDGIADRGSKGARASCPHLLSSSLTLSSCLLSAFQRFSIYPTPSPYFSFNRYF
jgi:hypothetical protein